MDKQTALNILIGCKKEPDWQHTKGMIQEACETLTREMVKDDDTLAEYKATGLTPAEIVAVQKALDPIPFGRFHDIMEAERAGKLVISSDAAENDSNVDPSPLTLGELRQMDGQPVWVELVVGTVGQKAGWTICYFDAASATATQRWTNWTLWYEDYGNTWVAYCQKPDSKGNMAENQIQQSSSSVVFPCKIGTTVYLMKYGKVRETRVMEFIFSGEDYICMKLFGEGCEEFNINKIGESIFFALEAAQAAAKEYKEKNSE